MIRNEVLAVYRLCVSPALSRPLSLLAPRKSGEVMFGPRLFETAGAG